MKLSPICMSRAIEALEKYADQPVSHPIDDRPALLKCSDAVIESIQQNLLDISLLPILMSIGTAFRRGNSGTKSEAQKLILAFPELVKRNDCFGTEYRKDFLGFAILRVYSQLLMKSDFLDNRCSLLWGDEKEKVLEHMEIYSTASKGEINNTYRMLKEYINALEGKSFIPGLYTEKIKRLHKYSNQENTSQKTLFAEAALAYLVDEHDVVPDYLGLFGLVDDLYAIDAAYSSCFESNVPVSNELLEELIGEYALIPNLLFSPTETDKGKDDLIAMSKHAQFIIASLFKASEQHRLVNLILPQTTILIYYYLLSSRMLQMGDPAEYPRINPLEEQTRYFVDSKQAIEFKIIGQGFGSESYKIRTKTDASVRDLPKTIIELSQPQNTTRKNVSKDGNTLTKYLNRPQFFAPKIFQKTSNSNRLQVLLTRKSSFERANRSLRPFGVNLSDALSANYISISDNIEDLDLGKSNNLLIFSNPDLLSEIFSITRSSDIQLELYSDDIVLMDSLLSLLSDLDLAVITKSVLLSNFQDEGKIKQLKKSGFTSYLLDDFFQEFDTSHLSHQDVRYVTNEEKLYEKFLSNSQKEVTLLSHHFIDGYYQLKYDLLSELRSADEIDFSILHSLRSFEYNLVSNWYPVSKTREENIEHSVQRLFSALENCSHIYSSANQFVTFLRSNTEKFRTEGYYRSIDEFFKEKGQNLYFLARSDEDKCNAISVTKSKWQGSVSIISPTDLKVLGYVDGRLIVPSLHLPKTTIKYLAENRVSDSISLQLFKAEREIFDYYSQAASSKKLRFSNRAKKILSSSSVSRRRTESFKIQKAVKKVDTPIDVNIDQNYSNNQLREIERKQGSRNGVALEALLFSVLEREGLLILPKRGDTIQVKAKNNEENSIVYSHEHAEQLSSLDKVLIFENAKSDIVEDLARSIDPEFSSIKAKSSLWREALNSIWQNSGCDDNELQKTLKAHGIDRTPITIKNWLFDDKIVSPRNPQKNVRKIYEILGGGEFGSVDDVLLNIERVYQLRRNAYENLIGILNAKASEISGEAFKIKVGSQKLQCRIFTISDSFGAKKLDYNLVGKFHPFIGAKND